MKTQLGIELDEALASQKADLDSQLAQKRVQNAVHLNNTQKLHKQDLEKLTRENNELACPAHLR